MLWDLIHSVRVIHCVSLGFVYEARDCDRIDADECSLGTLEVNSHELLPPLLLEMCSGVGERLLDDCGLYVDESFLKNRSTDEAEVL